MNSLRVLCLWPDSRFDTTAVTQNNPGITSRLIATKTSAYSAQWGRVFIFAHALSQPHGPNSTAEYSSAQVSIMKALNASSSLRSFSTSRSFPAGCQYRVMLSLGQVLRPSVHGPQ